MSDYDFGNPPAGSTFDKSEHEGNLCLFVNISRESGDTKHGFAEWAKVEYAVDLDDGSVSRDAAVFGTVLAPQIYDAGSHLALGRVVRGEASSGRSAPWLLASRTAEDETAAKEWLDDHGATKQPDGRYRFNVEP